MKDRKVIRISGTMALVLFCSFMLLLIFFYPPGSVQQQEDGRFQHRMGIWFPGEGRDGDVAGQP